VFILTIWWECFNVEQIQCMFFSRFQSKMQFVPWACGNAMKTGLCSVPPPGLTSSVLSLINTSNMSSLFKDVAQKFNKLYQRKVNICYSLFYLWCNCISTCWYVFRRCLIWIVAYTLSVMAEFFLLVSSAPSSKFVYNIQLGHDWLPQNPFQFIIIQFCHAVPYIWRLIVL